MFIFNGYSSRKRLVWFTIKLLSDLPACTTNSWAMESYNMEAFSVRFVHRVTAESHLDLDADNFLGAHALADHIGWWRRKRAATNIDSAKILKWQRRHLGVHNVPNMPILAILLLLYIYIYIYMCVCVCVCVTWSVVGIFEYDQHYLIQLPRPIGSRRICMCPRTHLSLWHRPLYNTLTVQFNTAHRSI